jgi:L-aminopeptidase/D-esterase-like protein
MFKSNRSRFACLCATGALVFGAGTSNAVAQTDQEGLVNVNVEGVTIQAPISVAANICDVNVNVLSGQLDSPAGCEASAESDAVSFSDEAPPAEQDGLVNVNVQNVVVQLPITVAANVCDVNVNVLSTQVDLPSACDADADSDAIE